MKGGPPGEPAAVEVLMLNRQRRLRVPLRRLARRTRFFLEALGSPELSVAVVLVSDRRIAQLNRRFLDRRGPTNVIAFPAGPGAQPGAGGVLGDVVVSVETAAREARAAGVALGERLTDLVLHGVLHLHGYDHEAGGPEAQRMARRARALRRRLAAVEGARPRGAAGDREQGERR
ncbi:MAG: rRNA maturation RNase YbeY [Desulfobacterales bacterium]